MSDSLSPYRAPTAIVFAFEPLQFGERQIRKGWHFGSCIQYVDEIVKLGGGLQGQIRTASSKGKLTLWTGGKLISALSSITSQPSNTSNHAQRTDSIGSLSLFDARRATAYDKRGDTSLLW